MAPTIPVKAPRMPASAQAGIVLRKRLPMSGSFYIYILATREDGPIYVGVTNDLHRRVFEHKTHAVKGFTAKYNVDRLVYFEVFESIEAAITREKQLKKWRQAWKVALIERGNPEWRDLAEEFVP